MAASAPFAKGKGKTCRDEISNSCITFDHSFARKSLPKTEQYFPRNSPFKKTIDPPTLHHSALKCPGLILKRLEPQIRSIAPLSCIASCRSRKVSLGVALSIHKWGTGGLVYVSLEFRFTSIWPMVFRFTLVRRGLILQNGDYVPLAFGLILFGDRTNLLH